MAERRPIDAVAVAIASRACAVAALAGPAMGCQILSGLDELDVGGADAAVPATPSNPWNDVVAGAPTDPSSASRLAWIATQGAFDPGLGLSFSPLVLEADSTTPFEDFVPTDAFYSPDCDLVPFPLPAGGAVEAETGYACLGDDDCHLLVFDRAHGELYEMYRAFAPPSAGFTGGCVAVWDLAATYPPDLRGEGCTGADASGLPIALTLLTPEEVAADSIGHALRIRLPEAAVRAQYYLHPATHALDTATTDARALVFGARLRLSASFAVDALPGPAARTVARALQERGALVVGVGPTAIEAADDRFSTRRWSELGLGADSLASIDAADFEIVDTGPSIDLADCVRNP